MRLHLLDEGGIGHAHAQGTQWCRSCPQVMQHVFVHLSSVTRSKESHRQEALGISKTFECNKCDFSAKSKGVLKHHEHLEHKKEATLTCELCNCRKSNAQYLKSHMQALC